LGVQSVLIPLKLHVSIKVCQQPITEEYPHEAPTKQNPGVIIFLWAGLHKVSIFEKTREPAKSIDSKFHSACTYVDDLEVSG